jgi:hypothetical protein
MTPDLRKEEIIKYKKPFQQNETAFSLYQNHIKHTILRLKKCLKLTLKAFDKILIYIFIALWQFSFLLLTMCFSTTLQ